MTRPPWWRPLKRRKWDREERARRDALPKTTTASLADIYKEPIEAIIAYQHEPNAVAYYFPPRGTKAPYVGPSITSAAIRFGNVGDDEEGEP